jgi:hypothetical protein
MRLDAALCSGVCAVGTALVAVVSVRLTAYPRIVHCLGGVCGAPCLPCNVATKSPGTSSLLVRERVVCGAAGVWCGVCVCVCVCVCVLCVAWRG